MLVRISGKGIRSALLTILTDSKEFCANHGETAKKSPLFVII
jgi:hypothetical protein